MSSRPVLISDEIDRKSSFVLNGQALKSFDAIDKLSAGQRECVHEFGFAIVKACIDMGVSQPNRIRFLVHTIWSGARQPQQRMGKGPAGAVAKLDWLLLQQNCGVRAETLLRTLADNNFVFVPRTPTAAMIDASLDATNHMGVVSKREKHQNRLIAAIKAQMRSVWPGYFS